MATCDDDLDHFPKKVMEMMQVAAASADDKKFVKGAPVFSPAQIEILCNSRSWNSELGQGIIDWEDVKNAAEAQPAAAQPYISEREFFGYYGHEGNPMEFAKRGLRVPAGAVKRKKKAAGGLWPRLDPIRGTAPCSLLHHDPAGREQTNAAALPKKAAAFADQ